MNQIPGIRRAYRGYTLVELMTVVAIIAILAAILMSVLVSAKAKSYETVDVEQLRQVHVAVVLYEEQNDGIAPIQLDQLDGLVTDKRIFRSPVDPVVSPSPTRGGYPVRLFFGEDERASYRISYVYLRSYPPYDYDLRQWQTLRSQPEVGMLACPWHGKKLPSMFTNGAYDDFGPPVDGPVLRICMDGSFFRLAKRREPTALGSVDDMFYNR
jgi:prepilin-type N-terminal cleavage/methylation domain-containing protein